MDQKYMMVVLVDVKVEVMVKAGQDVDQLLELMRGHGLDW
jgi:hypothetical protein